MHYYAEMVLSKAMMRSCLLIFLMIIGSKLPAQYIEIGVFGGLSNYQGDLAPIAFSPRETHLSTGLFAKYNFNSYLSAKASIYHGTISGNDQNSYEKWAQQRNLSFASKINEIALHGEINLLGYQPHLRKKLLSPYAFAGIAVFTFNPMASYNGTQYALQPLGTEGQGTTYYPDRKPYALTQFSVPLGIGFKGSLSKNWNIGIEFGWRKTFTDYLDDVSSTYVAKNILVEESGDISWQLSNRSDEVNDGVEVLKDDRKLRGDPINKDWYIFSGVLVSYNFGLLGWDEKKITYYEEDAGYKGLRKSRKKMGCPNPTKKE